MNYLKGRELHGKIRPGQLWKKRDMGSMMHIIGKEKGDSWRVVFDRLSPRSSHKIKERVIYSHYDRIA